MHNKLWIFRLLKICFNCKLSCSRPCSISHAFIGSAAWNITVRLFTCNEKRNSVENVQESENLEDKLCN